MFELERGTLTASVFNELSQSVGWGHPPIEQTELALKHSIYTCCIKDQEQPIAMARQIGDWGMSYFIRDVVVRPDYQGKGIRTLLIQDLLDDIKQQKPIEWKVWVDLMSAVNKEPFDETFGFKVQPSVSGRAGISLIMN